MRNSISRPDVLVVNIDKSRNQESVIRTAMRMGTCVVSVSCNGDPWIESSQEITRFPDIKVVIHVRPGHSEQIAWRQTSERRNVEYVCCG